MAPRGSAWAGNTPQDHSCYSIECQPRLSTNTLRFEQFSVSMFDPKPSRDRKTGYAKTGYMEEARTRIS